MATDTDHTFDVIVIGLGPGGEDVAGQARRARACACSASTRGLVGGECPYWGCIPTKMMIRAANAARRGPPRRRARRRRPSVTPDWAPVATRIRDEATDNWDDKVAVDRLERQGRDLRARHGPPRRPAARSTSAAPRTRADRGRRRRHRHDGRVPADRRARRHARTGPTTRPSRPTSCPPRSSCSAAAPSAAS